MWRLAAVSVLVVGLADLVRSDQCLPNAQKHSDGCSIPFHLPYFFKDAFTPSCVHHDICYSCGLRFGIARSLCDQTFLHAINATCSKLPRDVPDLHLKRSLLRDVIALSRDSFAEKRDILPHMAEVDFCRLVSDTYYESVHLFAAGHFNIPSESFCDEDWVKSCLP